MTLEKRVLDLERNNRRWQWAVAALILLVALGMAMGQRPRRASERVLWAQRFEVRDSDATPLMTLSVGRDQDTPTLIVRDTQGRPRIELGIHNNQPALIFKDSNGHEIPYHAPKRAPTVKEGVQPPTSPQPTPLQ